MKKRTQFTSFAKERVGNFEKETMMLTNELCYFVLFGNHGNCGFT